MFVTSRMGADTLTDGSAPMLLSIKGLRAVQATRFFLPLPTPHATTHNTQHTTHHTTPHSTLHSPHSTLHTPRNTHHTPHRGGLRDGGWSLRSRKSMLRRMIFNGGNRRKALSRYKTTLKKTGVRGNRGEEPLCDDILLNVVCHSLCAFFLPPSLPPSPLSSPTVPFVAPRLVPDGVRRLQ